MNSNRNNHKLYHDNNHGQDSLYDGNRNSFNLDFKSSRRDSNATENVDTTVDQLDNDHQVKGNDDTSNNEGIEQAQHDDEMTTIEERQIHDSLVRERENAYSKLQETLECVRETTKTMLNEIDAFLESTESVMIDYTKCQNSQRNEARRLEEVEPDVVGATEMYLEKIKGMMG